MKAANILTLEKHRHFHDTLIKAHYVKGLNYIEKEDMLRVYREEWAPNASPDLWCGECLADFIKDLYNRFDKYLENNPQPIIGYTDGVGEAIQIPSEPKLPPVITKANFPKHKRK